MTSSNLQSALQEKLGIKPGDRVALIDTPEHYLDLLGELPPDVEIVEQGDDVDFIHLFASNRAQLINSFPVAKKRLRERGMLWVSWPKLTSSFAADLRDSIVREVGLAYGLVDVKVAAIDENWSGLKFVFRRDDRT